VASGIALAGFSAAPAAGQYEQPPSFQASQVLPPDLLNSPYYTVGNTVGLDNFRYVFRVDSKWGPFTVRGSDLSAGRGALWITGRASERATSQLAARGWTLQPKAGGRLGE
jgi:hypothetical protein